jgi:hypothetical protein
MVFGRLTQRWGAVPDLAAAGQKLQSFPTEIGNWQLLSDDKISDSVLQVLSCAGYVNRHYVNRQTGKTITIAIYVGPPGPISVHTPEICYSSIAYAIQDPRKEVTITDKDGREHSFWMLTFRSNKSSIDRLQVYYSWQGSGAWIASNSPRFQFAGNKLLYKMQMSTLVPAKDAETGSDACQDFLSALLKSGWNTSG